MPRNSIGTITQVIGAVVDVRFDGELPEILTALPGDQSDERFKAQLEQHAQEKIAQLKAEKK